MTRRLLTHEWVFTAFLASSWARLAWQAGLGGRDTVTFLALLALNAACVLPGLVRETPARWRLRLGCYPVIMNLAFTALRPAVPAMRPFFADGLLQAADRRLVGGNASLFIEPWVHPALTELLSACYFLFFPYILFSWVYYFVGDLERLKRFFEGLFTIYGIGFLGYTLLPAAGPWVAMADRFHGPLRGWVLTDWNEGVVRTGSNGVDVFPSLHCGVSLYFLLFDRRNAPWRFRAYLLPCVGLWIATIYLRYHYVVDVIAGFALSLGVQVYVRRRERAAA